VKDPDSPDRTKQLMILWSTKYTKDIKIMDKKWSVRQVPAWDGAVLKFNGVTAAWWYDNQKMLTHVKDVTSALSLRTIVLNLGQINKYSRIIGEVTINRVLETPTDICRHIPLAEAASGTSND
jgi:hypothetical protein